MRIRPLQQHGAALDLEALDGEGAADVEAEPGGRPGFMIEHQAEADELGGW